MNGQRIGERLRKLRTDADLKIDDVACAVHVSRSTINMYELGLRIPADDIKKKLAKYFKTSVNELFFDDE